MNFLSEHNIEMHKEYLNGLRLKLRIFEKSYPKIVGKDIKEMFKIKIPKSEREIILKLRAEIEAHRLYFSSFSEQRKNSERIKKEYGSVPEFLYELNKAANASTSGFLLIYEQFSKIQIYTGDEYYKIIASGKALLGLDLCEHAYFYDYGFSREKYILNAISHFDLAKCEKSMN